MTRRAHKQVRSSDSRHAARVMTMGVCGSLGVRWHLASTRPTMHIACVPGDGGGAQVRASQKADYRPACQQNAPNTFGVQHLEQHKQQLCWVGGTTAGQDREAG